MLIHYMHSYCGGRLLTGLYNPSSTSTVPGHVWNMCAKNWREAGNGQNTTADPCLYLPGSELEFLQILKKFLYVDHGDGGYQGVVFAVTNHEQKIAHSYLKAAGFKEAGRFRKGVGHNECITWIGDYRKDMFPILSKVPNYSEIQNEPKFRRALSEATQTTVNLTMPQPVYNTIRDSAQQTLSPANSGQSTIRPRAAR